MDEPFGAVWIRSCGGGCGSVIGAPGGLGEDHSLVTHDVTEALTLGDRIALLQKGGKLAQVGSPEELAMDPANSFTERFMGVTRATLGVRRAADGRRFAVDDRGAFVGVLGPNNPGEMGAP